jgi:hypothetical protein
MAAGVGFVYSVPGKVHDAFFGSSDLEQRTYEQFALEARTIGDSLKYKDAKISWSPGKTPSYDCPHTLLWCIEAQSIVRTLKDNLPGFVANALKSSTNAIEWSDMLMKKFTIRESDKQYFEIAQRAFLEQSRIYAKEFQTSKLQIDDTASKNYNKAAENLGIFINIDKMKFYSENFELAKQVLQPQGYELFVRLQKEVLNTQPWFQALLPKNSSTQICLVPTPQQRLLNCVLPPELLGRVSESKESKVPTSIVPVSSLATLPKK